jgi:beta-lactamase class A
MSIRGEIDARGSLVSQRRRIGPPARMRPAVPARPTHAGRLARWERLAFALALAAMAAFILVITVWSAGLRRSGALPPGTGGPAGPPAPALSRGGPARIAPAPIAPGGQLAAAEVRGRPVWNRRLATALAPVLAQQSGTLGVGVVDRSTGAVAIYGGGLKFHAASIEKVAILAGLLLKRPVPALSDPDDRLATTMIEASDDGAATHLWNADGRAAGLTAADLRLGLRHTVPGPGDYWGLTSTTVGDQLTLLQDLTTARSPLPAAARSYELRLMRATDPGQRWGISAAASPGTRYAVKDGWLPDGSAGVPADWVINSIGAVEHDQQHLLLAVLSARQPTEAAGIAAVQAAAAAAAACITASR